MQTRRFTVLFPYYATAVLFLAVLCAAGFLPQRAKAADFLRLIPGIEKRIEQALPGFDVSIDGVGASAGKGLKISGISVFKDGQTVATARSVFISYGSVVSSVFDKNFLSSSGIEIEGLRISVSRDIRRIFQTSAGAGETADSFQTEKAASKSGKPKIKITDSVIFFSERRVEAKALSLSFSRASGGGLKIAIKDGHVLLPHLGITAKDLSLDFEIAGAQAKAAPSVLSGGGIFDSSLGSFDAAFDFSLPVDAENQQVWSGRLFLSEMFVLKRKTALDIKSAAFDKNGELSISASTVAGLAKSDVEIKIQTAPGGWIPRLAGKAPFEVEWVILKNDLPAALVKFEGSVDKRGENSVISGVVSDFYSEMPDLFGIEKLKSAFELSMNGYRVDSAGIVVESSGLTLQAQGRASGKGGFQADYTVQSDDIFLLSEITRSFGLYEMSGLFKSSGEIERTPGGNVFLSGNARIKDFSATVRKRAARMENGKIDFRVPLGGSSFENLFLKSSFENFSYRGMFARKADFSLEDTDLYAKFEFENKASLSVVATAIREKKQWKAEVEKAELKSKNSRLSLSDSFLISFSGGKVEVGQINMSGGKSYLRFSGSYETGENPAIKVDGGFAALNTELFEPFAPSLSAYRGLIDGKAVIDGRLDWPVINLKAGYESARSGEGASISLVRDQFSKRLLFNLTINGEQDNRFLSAFGGISSFAGIRTYLKQGMANDTSSYDLTLKATNFPVKPIAFLSRKIQNLEGDFSGELSVSGQSGDLSMKGGIEIDGAKVKVGDWTETMELMSADLDFPGGSKIVSTVNLRDPFGTAQLEGTFDAADFSYNFEALLKGIYLKIKHLHSGYYGPLLISGSGRNIRVSGRNIKTKNANIRIRKNHNVAVGDIVFIDSECKECFAEGKSPGFFARTSDLDLRIRVSEDTRLELDRVDSLLSGDLFISRKPGDNFSSVKGELKVLRGSYSMLGKQFLVDKGLISFSSREHLSPIIDIDALYERGGLSVKANLYGEASNLDLRLSSIPAMKEDDIILALVSGRGRQNETGASIMETVIEGQTRNYSPFGYAADELFSEAFENSPFKFVDVFSITRTGAGILDSEIEVGVHITDRLYTTYERVNETLPIAASYKNRFVAQYMLGRNFILEGIAGGITPGVNLLFSIDFR